MNRADRVWHWRGEARAAGVDDSRAVGRKGGKPLIHAQGVGEASFASAVGINQEQVRLSLYIAIERDFVAVRRPAREVVVIGAVGDASQLPVATANVKILAAVPVAAENDVIAARRCGRRPVDGGIVGQVGELAPVGSHLVY